MAIAANLELTAGLTGQDLAKETIQRPSRPTFHMEELLL